MQREFLHRPGETITTITGRFSPNIDAAVREVVREQQTLRSLLTRPRVKTVRRIDACTFEIRSARMTWAEWRAEVLEVLRRTIGLSRVA